MSDSLTVLRSRGLRMTKLWRRDGSIEPYGNAKWFTVEQHNVATIDDLSALLFKLEREPNVCVVRGRPKTSGELRRLVENFDDVPLHAILIEVDQYRPLVSDPLVGEDSALEYIAECLPSAFHDVSFHWQLSNSAGHKSKQDVLKIHLWMMLDTAYDSATLRAWTKAESLQLDHSVLQVVQPHFVAAPMFEEGVSDPVQQRSGLWRGSRDAVPLVIDTDALKVKPQGVRQRGETRHVDDPLADHVEAHWETWGTLGNGGLMVSCPWDAEHSGGGKGDTSSVYFPAGTNDYAEGAYVCLHNACRERTRTDFASAVGYTESRLAMLAEPEPDHPPGYVNGHILNDPLVLPPFKRTQGGVIITTLTNVTTALEHPQVIGIDLRYDVFKDEVLCAWRDRAGPIADTDYTEMRIALEARGIENVGREMIRDAVHLVAKRHSFDSAIDWLDTCEWDGVPRIETFWTDYFGVPDDERGYVRAVALYTWTALAGRVLHPGMQADMVPILTGDQGLGKSRGVAAIAPNEEFVTSISFNEPEIERARKMRGRLVIELAELQGLRSREREEILAWVTRSSEHWTPKFMEMSVTYSRRAVLFGTTNARDFLDDPTGERRWLPLDTGRAPGFRGVDVEALVANRKQLWAEGRARFEKDGLLWKDAERLARGEHARFKADDSWASAIAEWLDAPNMAEKRPRERDYLTVLAVAQGALGIPARLLKPVDQRRIGKVLVDEGYRNVAKRIEGKPVKVWMKTA